MKKYEKFYKCEICKVVFTSRGIGPHVSRKHKKINTHGIQGLRDNGFASLTREKPSSTSRKRKYTRKDKGAVRAKKTVKKTKGAENITTTILHIPIMLKIPITFGIPVLCEPEKE